MTTCKEYDTDTSKISIWPFDLIFKNCSTCRIEICIPGE